MNRVFRKVIWIAVLLFFFHEPTFAGKPGRKEKLENSVPQFIYVHAGLGGNLFVVGSENMERVMDPFKLGPVNFGYSYYTNTGIRNIVQIEFRWGKDSNSFFYDEGFTQDFKIKRTRIPMKFSHKQWLVKVNPIFFIRKLRSWAFFVVRGKGDVNYEDEVGDGFLDGKKSVTGIEVSRILKFFEIGVSIEKHSMIFERFNIDGLGTLLQDFDASYLQFNLRFAVGLGL